MDRGVTFLILLAVSAPAFAQASAVVPEPSDLALFALGVVGLFIGRRSSRRPPRNDP